MQIIQMQIIQMQIIQRSFRLILTSLVMISASNAMAQQLLAPGKPFSNYRPAPTVSPYMNLFRGGDGTDFDYQTLVLPFIRQQELNQRQQRTNLQQYQTNLLQGQTNQTQRRDIRRASQATVPFPQTPLRPTGMVRSVGSRYMNLYNYYPATRAARRR